MLPPPPSGWDPAAVQKAPGGWGRGPGSWEVKQTLRKKSTFRNRVRNVTVCGDKLEGSFEIIQNENIPEISRTKESPEARWGKAKAQLFRQAPEKGLLNHL